MQVILREDIPNLGRPGDVVKVRDGYARNFLLPRSLAVEANPRSLRAFEHEKLIGLMRREGVRKGPLQNKKSNQAVSRTGGAPARQKGQTFRPNTQHQT